MKKIKFLNGMNAVLACAAVALATTFTSCEKEEFTVKFEPSPAMVCFTPNVIDAATNQNVTAQATITGANDIVSTASDKALVAGEVTIKAELNGVSGSITVKYPAVAAGQTVSLSPVIILSPEFGDKPAEVKAETVGSPIMKYGNAAAGIDHNGKTWAKNESEYLVNYKAEWKENAFATKGAETKSVVATPDQLEVKNEGEKNLQASAWCMYNAEYAIQGANVKYRLTATATGETIEVIYYNPIYKITVTHKEMPLPGHEHAYEHGHGHGDNPNAGGGIVLGD